MIPSAARRRCDVGAVLQRARKDTSEATDAPPPESGRCPLSAAAWCYAALGYAAPNRSVFHHAAGIAIGPAMLRATIQAIFSTVDTSEARITRATK